MRIALVSIASLAFAACPASAQGPEAPLLVAHGDGSVTITRAIESDPPRLVPVRIRNAGRARAQAEADRAEERAYQEAVDQAREAARLPRPR